MKITILLLICLSCYANAQFGFPGTSSLKFPGADLASKIAGNASLPSLSSLPKIPIITDLLKKDFGSFKDSFNKVYKTAEEETLRLNIFALNKEKISDFNKLFQQGVVGFTQKVNSFSDLLHDEFVKQFNGYGKNLHPASKKVQAKEHFKAKGQAKVPEHVDWREKGAVTPVKSQEKCAACWAFAAAGALEAHNFKKSGKLSEVSVQNLIDCATPYGNSGCDGGLMNPAFEYVKDNKGVAASDPYPFESKNGQCRFKPGNVAATCQGFVDIPENDEKSLEMAVATEGPVTVAINAGLESFQFYDDGIYDDPKCDDNLNHAVLIVGFGEENGKKYWIVKNSYGPEWGKDGYVKIARGKNQCGIAIQASYPLI